MEGDQGKGVRLERGNDGWGRDRVGLGWGERARRL